MAPVVVSDYATLIRPTSVEAFVVVSDYATLIRPTSRCRRSD